MNGGVKVVASVGQGQNGGSKEGQGNGGGAVPRISFWDKVLGGKGGSFERLEKDLVKKNLVLISCAKGDCLQPKVVFARVSLRRWLHRGGRLSLLNF